MKNFSKNNYSQKDRDKDSRRSQSKNNYRSNNSHEDKFNSSKNNTFKKIRVLLSNKTNPNL